MPNATLEIAKREFLEHVLSWRFLIALALSTLIVVTSIVALSATYEEDLDTYEQRQDVLTRGFGMAQAGEINRVIGKPNILSVFVGGPGDEHRTDYAGRQGMYDPSVSAQPGSASPTNTRFSPLDLGFVGAVVMTFMAVIFSFDAISGEKERGTLKLVLANPVPKDAILLGKFLGGLSSILAALAFAVICGLAALSLRGLKLGGDEALRLVIIGALMMLLLSAFYLLGLLVSSLSRRSSTSLLVLTMLWLMLVFGTGNVAAFVAKETAPTTSNSELQAQERILFDETEAEAIAIGEELSRLHQKRMGGNLTADEQARMDELQAERDAVYARGEERRLALRASALRQLDGQLGRAERIASLSVVDSFRSLATMVARSDYWTYRELVDATQEYEREVQRERQEWLKANPPPSVGTVGPGGTFSVVSFQPHQEFEPPKLNYEPASVSAQLSSGNAMMSALVLLGYNLAAFIGAYVAFLRYDVR